MRTIAQRCADDGGITKVTLEDLRDEVGKQKLGKWVLGSIQELLEGESLGYFPLETLDPAVNTAPRKEQTVWIYGDKAGTIAQVIDVILHPGGRDVAAALRSLIGQNHASLTSEEKLKAIQEIVSA